MNFDLGGTTFDLQDTAFVDNNIQSGGAYTATMYNTKFIVDDRLMTDNVTAMDGFGRGVCAIDNTVFVGAPKDDGNTTKIRNNYHGSRPRREAERIIWAVGELP